MYEYHVRVEVDPIGIEESKPLVCRGCLSDERPLQPLGRALATLYDQLVSTDSLEADAYPQWVCSYCRALLLKFSKFRDKCRSSQYTFLRIISAGIPVTVDPLKSVTEIPYPNLQRTLVQSINIGSPDHEEASLLVPVKIEEGDDYEIPLLMEDRNGEKGPPKKKRRFEPSNKKKEEDTIKTKPEIQEAPLEELSVAAPVTAKVEDPKKPKTGKGKKRKAKSKPTDAIAAKKCLQMTKIQGNLKTHVKTRSKKAYACNICDYKCNFSRSLKDHMRKHTGDYYTCHLCSYRTIKGDHLKQHIRTHTGEKPYACNQCSYKTTQSSNMKSHMRNHTGEQPYSCNSCSYSSTQSGNLKIHMRTHTGEKPYACNSCSYKTTRSDVLKSHMRSHTGEKPYACNICSKKYSRNMSFKIHMKTHL